MRPTSEVLCPSLGWTQPEAKRRRLLVGDPTMSWWIKRIRVAYKMTIFIYIYTHTHCISLYIYNVMILYSTPKKDRKVNPIHTKRVTTNLGNYDAIIGIPLWDKPKQGSPLLHMFPPSLSSWYLHPLRARMLGSPWSFSQGPAQAGRFTRFLRKQGIEVTKMGWSTRMVSLNSHNWILSWHRLQILVCRSQKCCLLVHSNIIFWGAASDLTHTMFKYYTCTCVYVKHYKIFDKYIWWRMGDGSPLFL